MKWVHRTVGRANGDCPPVYRGSSGGRGGAAHWRRARGCSGVPFFTMGERGLCGEGVRLVAVMDGSGVKSSVGWHLEVRRRDEDNGNGL
jgi:hypothetical protein